MIPRLSITRPLAAAAVLAVLFAFPGIVGHDPWKTADAVTISVVHGMAASGDWLVPRVGGMYWFEDPPLYHWVALLLTRIGGGVLPFHDLARLASLLFLLAACALLAHAASASRGRETDPSVARAADPRDLAATAVLLLFGSVGLVFNAHTALPELAGMAAVAGVLASEAAAADDSQLLQLRRTSITGIALGALGLSVGLAAAACLWFAVAVAAGLSPERARRLPGAALSLAVASAIALGWLHALPAEALAAWVASIRGASFSVVENIRYYAVAFSWFAWPGSILAVWSIWTLRAGILRHAMLVPTAGALALLVAIVFGGPPRELNLVTILPCVALLGAHGVPSLRRGARAALDWFGAMTFGFFVSLVWLGYLAMMTGLPPRVANNFAKLAPGFSAEFSFLPFVFAFLLTLGWLVLLFRTAESPVRGVMRWAGGLTMLWGCFALLWIGWADHQKSYRSVAEGIRSGLPKGNRCIAEQGLGLAPRAALHYHADLLFVPFDASSPRACALVLTQASPHTELPLTGESWEKLVDVGRPGDKSERFRLYRWGP